ncbi:hypothetical protein SDC9_52618 [bioreactor metagenome]|uniref:Uncharacterized protein n=1 Tax=bioreactor metagenome TaxID=1076179 RepID=A0A644WRJ4_9ZZZZ
MDGYCHEKIDIWFDLMMNYFQTGKDIPSDHVTDILGEKPQAEWIDMLKFCLKTVAKRLNDEKLDRKYKLLGVFVLISRANSIKMKLPRSMEETINQLTIQPPSIYLMDWTNDYKYLLTEKYSCPLPFELIEDKRFYAFFNEYRGTIRTGVVRSIRIEYYPNGRFE